MTEKTISTVYLHALTPVHAGTGQVSASVVDLPIAREKATNWPLLPATSLKGVLRDRTPKGDREALFGSQDQVGALQFGDARLLCFPVRSWQGVFAYVSCPLALNRLVRDFAALNAPFPKVGTVPDPANESAMVAEGSVLAESGNIWLEDLPLTETKDAAVQAIAEGIAAAVVPEAERAGFVKRFALVSDNVFDFLTENATEITARIKLVPEKKTVDKEQGALWYEEAVPAEAIFVAPVLGELLPVASGTVVQIGGNETVGRGLCRMTVATK